MISTSFPSGHGCLSVAGDVDEQWDDCLFYKRYNGEAFAVTNGRRHFAVALLKRSVILYDRATTQQLAEFKSEGVMYTLLFSADDQYLVASGSLTVQVWDVAAKTLVATLKLGYRVLAVSLINSQTLCYLAPQKATCFW